jgi:hypothetical protein
VPARAAAVSSTLVRTGCDVPVQLVPVEPSQRIKRVDREFNHSPPTSVDIKKS